VIETINAIKYVKKPLKNYATSNANIRHEPPEIELYSFNN